MILRNADDGDDVRDDGARDARGALYALLPSIIN
jgi:hypothetical protein